MIASEQDRITPAGNPLKSVNPFEVKKKKFFLLILSVNNILPP